MVLETKLTDYEFTCVNCQKTFIEKYFRIGSKFKCPLCKKSTTLNYDHSSSIWYDSTYTDLIQLLEHVHIVQKICQWFNLTSIDAQNETCLMKDGSIVSLILIHEHIQTYSELQSAFYSMKMDVQK